MSKHNNDNITNNTRIHSSANDVELTQEEREQNLNRQTKDISEILNMDYQNKRNELLLKNEKSKSSSMIEKFSNETSEKKQFFSTTIFLLIISFVGILVLYVCIDRYNSKRNFELKDHSSFATDKGVVDEWEGITILDVVSIGVTQKGEIQVEVYTENGIDTIKPNECKKVTQGIHWVGKTKDGLIFNKYTLYLPEEEYEAYSSIISNMK